MKLQQVVLNGCACDEDSTLGWNAAAAFVLFGARIFDLVSLQEQTSYVRPYSHICTVTVTLMQHHNEVIFVSQEAGSGDELLYSQGDLSSLHSQLPETCSRL